MPRFIRYLAATDSSPIGMLALGYLSGLLRIAPVRVGSMTGGLSGRWEHYAQLLATPMTEDYVNVVCCAPEQWVWEQRVTMPTRHPDGTVDPTGEVISGRQEIYTEGKHNVLLTMECPVTDEFQLKTAKRYEEIVVPDDHAYGLWLSWRPGLALHRIPLPITDHEALRSVVMP
jgi:hypothetical protein